MRTRLVLGIAVATVTATGLTAAMATPASRASRTPISRGAVLVAEETAVTFRSGRDAEVVRLALEPGGSTGWHSHPSPGIFLVDKGTMSSYGLDGAACEALAVAAGQGQFVPEHPHHAHLIRNEGAERLEFTVAYFNVPPRQPTRIEADRPAECPDDLQ